MLHIGFAMGHIETINPEATIFHHEICIRERNRYDNMSQISGSFSSKESVGLIWIGMSSRHLEICTAEMLGMLSPTDS